VPVRVPGVCLSRSSNNKSFYNLQQLLQLFTLLQLQQAIPMVKRKGSPKTVRKTGKKRKMTTTKPKPGVKRRVGRPRKAESQMAIIESLVAEPRRRRVGRPRKAESQMAFIKSFLGF
jgi:hypothetical protein